LAIARICQMRRWRGGKLHGFWFRLRPKWQTFDADA